MSVFSDFQFLQPWALLTALPLIALGWWALQQRQGGRVWQQLFDAELLRRFLAEGQAVSSRKALVLLVLVSLMLAVALAQPVWRKLPQPVFATESALVVALDLSASMDATDVAPSRLKQAQFKLRDLLATRKEGQTALLVYAGDAFVVTPLTDDSATILGQLSVLETGIMPVQGSRPERALALADDLLRQAGVVDGDVLLIGDALDGEEVTAKAQAMRAEGRRISVLTVGTAAGAPVPGLRYSDGTSVIARTDIATMAGVARDGGGLAVQASADNSDITRLQALFSRSATEGNVQKTEREHDQWVAEGPWLILLALPLLLPLFRRGVLSVALVMVVAGLAVTPAQPVMAAESEWQQHWDNLWQRPDQQAMEKWRSGDRAGATAQFEHPDWQQAARYSQKDYKGAAEALQPETAEQWYNQGNALARQGLFDQALSAYEKSLQLNPENEDARANQKLVEEAKKQLDQNPQQNQQSGPGKQGQQNDSDQQQDQQSDSGQQSDQQGDNGQSDDQSGEGQQSADEQQAADSQAGQPSGDDAGSDGEQREANAAQSSADQQEADAEQQARQQQFGDALDQAEKQDADKASGSVERPESLDEQQQARQQLLNRVIDDPAGLWRRKFLYQYQQQAEPLPSGEQPW